MLKNHEDLASWICILDLHVSGVGRCARQLTQSSADSAIERNDVYLNEDVDLVLRICDLLELVSHALVQACISLLLGTPPADLLEFLSLSDVIELPMFGMSYPPYYRTCTLTIAGIFDLNGNCCSVTKVPKRTDR